MYQRYVARIENEKSTFESRRRQAESKFRRSHPRRGAATLRNGALVIRKTSVSASLSCASGHFERSSLRHISEEDSSCIFVTLPWFQRCWFR